MPHGSLIIRLSPSRLEVTPALRRGDAAGGGTIVRLAPDEWDAAWKQDLRPLDAPLREAVTALDAEGAAVVCVHDGPDAIVSLFSSPARGSAARRAAGLALAEQAPYPLESNPHAIVPLGHDGAGAPALVHALLAADAEPRASAVLAWLRRAGMRVERLLPLDAAIQHAAAVRRLSDRAPGVRIELRLGEQSAVISGGVFRDGDRGPRLLVLRRTDLSIETLTEALAHPITRRTDPGSPPVALTPEQARAMLFTVGVPRPEQVVDAALGLTGADVLPSLQPVLQRCVVELRQSLRFNFSEAERTEAILRLEGPGAFIPRLAEVLAGQIGLTAAPGPVAGTFDHALPGAPGGDLDEARRADPRLNLLPRAEAASREARSLRRTMWAGAALAAAVVAGDAILTLRAAESTAREAERIEQTAASVTALLSIRDQTAARMRAIAAMEHAMAEAAGSPTDWSAAFKELTLVTPEQVRFTTITISRPRGNPELSLTGYRMEEEPSPAERVDITRYVERLRASPLVLSATLGTTQRAVADARPAQQFTITLDLTTLPGQADAVSSAEPAEGDTP